MATKGFVIQNVNFKPCLSDLRSLVRIWITQTEHTLMFSLWVFFCLLQIMTEIFQKKILHRVIEISFDNVYKSSIKTFYFNGKACHTVFIRLTALGAY